MNYVELADTDKVFKDFIENRGPEEIARCYFTAMSRMQDERVWACFDEEGNRVAWAGMRQIEPAMRGYRLGVFKPFERRGHRRTIRDWLVEQAFADPATQIVRTSCQVSNPPQVVRMLNASVKGEWMEFKYATLEPRPTLWFHMTREFFETKVKR